MAYLIAYENSEKKGVAYYNDGGFPWWSYDRASGPTKYPTQEAAEVHAEQLRRQRARAGRIFVVPA